MKESYLMGAFWSLESRVGPTQVVIDDLGKKLTKVIPGYIEHEAFYNRRLYEEEFKRSIIKGYFGLIGIPQIKSLAQCTSDEKDYDHESLMRKYTDVYIPNLFEDVFPAVQTFPQLYNILLARYDAAYVIGSRLFPSSFKDHPTYEPANRKGYWSKTKNILTATLRRNEDRIKELYQQSPSS